MQTLFYRPVKSSIYSQGFGIEKTKPEMLKLYNDLGLRSHNGLDIPTWFKEPCYFNYIGKGKLVSITDDPKLGIGLTFLINDQNYVFQIRYWHFQDYIRTLKVGQEVESGDLLGYCDSTGYSTGNHLHFDLKRAAIRGSDDYEILNKNNGWFGAIDPDPYWEDKFVLDYIESLKQKIGIIQKIMILIKQI